LLHPIFNTALPFKALKMNLLQNRPILRSPAASPELC